MPDFKKGKIYVITNDYNDDVYVGSTCDTLVKRFSSHKAAANVEKNKYKPLYKLINEIGFNRFRIQLIKNYPCEDQYQLRQEEGRFIREKGALNLYIAGRDRKDYIKEYVKEHQNEIKEYKKEYSIEHKEHIKEKKKVYRQQNIEMIKERDKKYRENNKEYINESIMCCCGCFVSRRTISRHTKSKKHLELMEAKNAQQDTVEINT